MLNIDLVSFYFFLKQMEKIRGSKVIEMFFSWIYFPFVWGLYHIFLIMLFPLMFNYCVEIKKYIIQMLWGNSFF
jgi:hypothetical protein